jgi:hypothetical protein
MSGTGENGKVKRHPMRVFSAWPTDPVTTTVALNSPAFPSSGGDPIAAERKGIAAHRSDADYRAIAEPPIITTGVITEMQRAAPADAADDGSGHALFFAQSFAATLKGDHLAVQFRTRTEAETVCRQLLDWRELNRSRLLRIGISYDTMVVMVRPVAANGENADEYPWAIEAHSKGSSLLNPLRLALLRKYAAESSGNPLG